MRIALIATYTHPVALGLRFVSSYLKAAGHDVEMIFMSSKRDTAKPDWGPAALEALIERLRTRDLIGLGLMTNTFLRAGALTERIRAAGLRAPIIWGGTHPTVAPDESLEVADLICVGEGEEPMLQLVERLEAGRDPTDVPSLGFRAGGPFGNRQTIRNPVRTLERELDDYPFPDYELETHWVVEDGALVPARPDNLRGTLHRLRVETTRGCPYPCTFCNNAALLTVYRGKGSWVRKRSADNVVAEIRLARECFPTVEAVNLVDDLFFVRSEAEIEEFAVKYREQINLPLELDAFPNTITESKVRALMRVPISLISMGIQSGSPDTLKHIYKRPTPIEKIAEGIRIFQRNGIRAEYHYIVNNPYEPDANVIETLRFIADHHCGPAVLRVFPLMFYPGTPLYDRARADGLIGRRHDMAYEYMYTGGLQYAKFGYLAAWLRVVLELRNAGLPRWLTHRLIDFAVHPFTRRCLERRWVGRAAFGIYRVGRKLYRNFVYQPFVRPFKHWRRPPRYDELHPEDEVTLPRNNMGAAAAAESRPAEPRRARRRADRAARAATPAALTSLASPGDSGRWHAPRVNLHAQRYRSPAAPVPPEAVAAALDRAGGAAPLLSLPVLTGD